MPVLPAGRQSGQRTVRPRALTRTLLERHWITTREASRIVTVTEAGQAGLQEWLGIDLAELRAAA